jgi:hypothetical protein
MGTSRSFELLAQDPRLAARTLSTPGQLEVGTLDLWEKRRSDLLKLLRFWAGPDLRNPEAAVHVTAEHHYQGFKVQNIALETLPGFYVAGNLYIPDGEGPFPAVLHPHGHWSTGRFVDDSVASVPGRCINLALRGYVSLSYDMVGYGDTKQLGHRFATDDVEASAWGISLFGVQIQNGLACLDHLVAQPFVDETRIAVTGASGGGSQTIVLAAIDERIAVAIPVNMVSVTCQGWCLCENPPGLRVETNNMEIAALIAPRPMLLVSSSGDWTSRTPEVEYPQLRRVYELYGVPERIANAHIDAPHNYNMESRQATYRWVDRWFRVVAHEERYLEIPFPTPHRSSLEVDTRRLNLKRDGSLRESLLRAAALEAGDVATLPDGELRARLARLFGAGDGEPTYALLDEAVAGEWPDARCMVLRRPGGELIACWGPADDGQGGLAVVLLGPSSREAFRAHRRDLQRLVKAGMSTYVVETFLSEGWRGPEGRLGRSHAMPFFSTYNRTDAAEAVRDAVTAIDFFASRGRLAMLIGLGDGAIPLMLAGAMRPGEAVIVLEASGLSEGVAEGSLLPGFRRLVGFRGAARLLSSQRVLMFGPDSSLVTGSNEIIRELTEAGALPVVGTLADALDLAAPAQPELAEHPEGRA